MQQRSRKKKPFLLPLSAVPFEYIKQKVDVRLTSRSTVEVFFSGNRIASHPWLRGRPNQYSTNENHMPPDYQKYLQWNGERLPPPQPEKRPIHPEIRT